MELDELANEMYELNTMEEIEFYAHLTEKENGISINEKGLQMTDNKLSSAANLIDSSFYTDPYKYVDYKLGSPQTRRKDLMVIIACYKDEVNSLVKKSYNGFIIPSENILGFIDIKDKYFTNNPDSLFSIDSYNL